MNAVLTPRCHGAGEPPRSEGSEARRLEAKGVSLCSRADPKDMEGQTSPNRVGEAENNGGFGTGLGTAVESPAFLEQPNQRATGKDDFI